MNQSLYHSQAGNVIQINHGGGWFTTYLHMQVRYATAGQQVFQGQTIGRVGHTGPTSNGTPHLHFELAVDANGDGQASWGFAGSERVRPWFNGAEYAQSNGQTWLHVYSNNCGEILGVTSTSSRMHVFVRGTDRALYKKTYAGSWPVSWTRVDGSVLNSAPAAAAWRDANGAQRVDVFASGAPDANGITQVLQKTSYDDGNTFSGWQVIGGNLTTQPAATVLSGTLYLFGRGTNGNLYSRTTARHYDPRLGEYSYTWNAWERRTTDTLNSAPSAASFRNDQAQAWYIRADLHPYQVWWSGTTQAWAGPAQPGGSVGNLTGALGIMQWSDNFEVYGRGTDPRSGSSGTAACGATGSSSRRSARSTPASRPPCTAATPTCSPGGPAGTSSGRPTPLAGSPGRAWGESSSSPRLDPVWGDLGRTVALGSVVRCGSAPPGRTAQR